MFRYGSNYYVYDNGYWYRANRWNGPFVAITFNAVPGDFRTVPRREWRTYPSEWMAMNMSRHHHRHHYHHD